MRALKLTSGDVIWDLAGNIHQRTTGTFAGTQPGLASDSADTAVFSTKQWNNAGTNWNNLPARSRPSALASFSGLSNVTSWTSGNGLGQLFSSQNQTGVRPRRRLEGGPGTGLLALFLCVASSSGHESFGFRVVRRSNPEFSYSRVRRATLPSLVRHSHVCHTARASGTHERPMKSSWSAFPVCLRCQGARGRDAGTRTR